MKSFGEFTRKDAPPALLEEWPELFCAEVTPVGEHMWEREESEGITGLTCYVCKKERAISRVLTAIRDQNLNQGKLGCSITLKSL